MENTTPRPISEAPMDGTVILTDRGFCRYSPCWNIIDEWVACDPEGELYHCADDGYTYLNPKLWTPIPDWILNS
jgi:hypothetical protein